LKAKFLLIAIITGIVSFLLAGCGRGGGSGGGVGISTPPTLRLDYPDSNQTTVVGDGTLLTLVGQINQGSNPLSKLIVVDCDGSILQEWPITHSGEFRLDLERFGQQGEKIMKLRAVDSIGLCDEVQLRVINDDTLLDSEARDFLRKYATSGDGGTDRLGDLVDGPYTKKVRVYINTTVQWEDLIREACNFWFTYSGIELELVVEPTAEGPCIIIVDETPKDPGTAAATMRAGTNHKITTAVISLYKEWLNFSTEMKIAVLEHELAHALLTMQHVDDYGPLCVVSSSGMGNKVLPPIMQRATWLLYSHGPGWKP
jgi:hypothetical protein